MKIKNILLALVLSASFYIASAQNSGKEHMLGYLGASAAASVYNNHKYAEIIYDSYNSHIYLPEHCSELLEVQKNLIAITTDYLSKVYRSDYLDDPSDKLFTQAIMNTYSHVDAEISALIKYVNSGADADKNEYLKKSEIAFQNIAELLGL
jgi:hypothetical protein